MQSQNIFCDEEVLNSTAL